MKRTVYIAVLLVMILSATAQAQVNESLTKEEQKELNEKIDSIMFV